MAKEEVDSQNCLAWVLPLDRCSEIICKSEIISHQKCKMCFTIIEHIFAFCRFEHTYIYV